MKYIILTINNYIEFNEITMKNIIQFPSNSHIHFQIKSYFDLFKNHICIIF